MAVHEIAVGIMLDDERIRLKPIVKDLTAQNVPAHSPTQLIAVLFQPDVAFELTVEIIDLEAGVIRLVLGVYLSCTDKKALPGWD